MFIENLSLDLGVVDFDAGFKTTMNRKTIRLAKFDAPFANDELFEKLATGAKVCAVAKKMQIGLAGFAAEFSSGQACVYMWENNGNTAFVVMLYVGGFGWCLEDARTQGGKQLDYAARCQLEADVFTRIENSADMWVA